MSPINTRTKPTPHVIAFFLSCVLHGLLLGVVVGLVLFYRSHLPPPPSGSSPGAPTIRLETMVIAVPPAAPKPVVPPAPAPSVEPALTATAAEIPPKPAPPAQGAPVLAAQPIKSVPMSATQVKPFASTPPANPLPSAKLVLTHPKPAASPSLSSYASGVNIFPHPPYPDEARDRNEAGTVTVSVEFDAQGRAVKVGVAQTSGARDLDRFTCAFIREHWRSPPYAGQTISVPVEYKLEDL